MLVKHSGKEEKGSIIVLIRSAAFCQALETEPVSLYRNFGQNFHMSLIFIFKSSFQCAVSQLPGRLLRGFQRKLYYRITIHL